MWYGSSDVRDMKPSTRLNHLITKASLAKSSIGLGAKRVSSRRITAPSYRATAPSPTCYQVRTAQIHLQLVSH